MAGFLEEVASRREDIAGVVPQLGFLGGDFAGIFGDLVACIARLEDDVDGARVGVFTCELVRVSVRELVLATAVEDDFAGATC